MITSKMQIELSESQARLLLEWMNGELLDQQPRIAFKDLCEKLQAGAKRCIGRIETQKTQKPINPAPPSEKNS